MSNSLQNSKIQTINARTLNPSQMSVTMLPIENHAPTETLFALHEVCILTMRLGT